MKVRRIFAIVMALGVAVLPAAAGASTGWVIQPSPSPGVNNYNTLRSVSCTAANACTAVGYYTNDHTGVTIAERWNGTSWKVQPTPNPTGAIVSYLFGVKCVSATSCTAVGYYESSTGDQMMAERWNGSSWKLQLIANSTGVSNPVLDAVACTTATNCMAVGNYPAASGATDLLAEHWNGTSWKSQPIPSPAGATLSGLQGISCTSGTACTAVGYDDTNSVNAPLAESWNGTSWKIRSLPSGGSVLEAVKCTSATSCVAVGDGGLAESWNGSSWTIQPTPASGDLYGVSCTSASSCTAIGTDASQSVTLAEYWNGSNWAVQPTPNPVGNTGAALYADSCTSATTCTAVGTYFDSSSNGKTLAEQET